MEKFDGANIEIKHPQEAAAILTLASLDQQMRNGYPDREDLIRSVDEQSTEQMKRIVADIGWPTISKVGPEASNMAWLLVQHADREPAFQVEALKLMLEFGEDEVEPKRTAYLIDRVLVNLTIKSEFTDPDLKLEDETIELLNQIESWVDPKLRLNDSLSEVVGNADMRGVQIYGSQFSLVDKEGAVRPILDRARLDERRDRVGLGPFAEYEKEMQARYR